MKITLALFDLPGPQFLFFYCLAFLAAIMWASWVKQHLVTRAPEVVAHPDRPWSVYQAACLAGDANRVVAALLARLAHQGAVVAGPGGHGYVLQQPLPPQLDELERALCAMLAHGPRDFTQLRQEPFPALERMKVRLMQEGWLVDPASSRSVTLRRLATLPLAALPCIGLIKIAAGLARDKPVFFLIVAVLFTWWVWKATHRELPFLTDRGKQHLAALNQSNAALELSLRRANDSLALDDVALGVALFGTAVLATAPLSWMRQRDHPVSAVGCSGDGGESRGSSCGDGGGGGGGGGGCGGCGGG